MTDDNTKKKKNEIKPDVEKPLTTSEKFSMIDKALKDLSCPEGYPPDAWNEKSDAAKRAYIQGIENSKQRTGAKS